MPDWLQSVIDQILVTGGVILAAGIPAYFSFKSKLAEINTGTQAAAKDAKEARIHVKNSHDTNMREVGDERHEATMAALTALGRDVRGLREDHYATRKDIGTLHAEDRAGRRETQHLRQELTDHLEQTAGLMPTLEKLIQQHTED
ncbi:hypothetical protein GCM10009715_43600 [Paeniglutamicibacter psychrophenolicus]|uniref:DUF2746 domain-containing protein n=1 Tax=Paeniglutamicibacter psychrophenolicus TaxID=257454 RepID=A0ABS4WDY1_9MICC|nr:hypothetical protein [Paeniglutamicibacter psychrophenolicus]MBP2374420.1 hypothetical protein [Paeniglutamicibacter psychrophenolicus]